MKMIANYICRCGETYEEKIKTGYMSARSLGRPRGAKGKDTWEAWFECPGCGKICIELPRIPEPCYVCGNPKPIKEHNMISICEEVTGMYEWVPGIANTVNTCGEDCLSTLKEKVDQIMGQAFFE